MVRVKICGITSLDDARSALRAGADALGFVFYKKSPRNISVAQARSIIKNIGPLVITVGVFVNAAETKINEIVEEVNLSFVQLSGDEPADIVSGINRRVIYTLHLNENNSGLSGLRNLKNVDLLVDRKVNGLYGGSGKTTDWRKAAEIAAMRPIILAGGLSPNNVREAILRVKPAAVDVSSGVESGPGKKDPVLMHEFVKKAKTIEF